MSTSPPREADLSATAAPIVRFDQVGFTRGRHAIFRGLSFALAPGSFHWLTGPPGSGKLSLLRLIALAERPTQGVAQVFGRDVTTLSGKEAATTHRRIGAVLDPLVFVDHLSVRENAGLPARVIGRRLDDYAGEVNAILKWVGLAKAADARPSDLPLADRRRLALGRALINRPELLLIDEPDGIDTSERQRVLRLAAEVHAAGATVVIVCQDEALAVASRLPIIRLQDGRASLAEIA